MQSAACSWECKRALRDDYLLIIVC